MSEQRSDGSTATAARPYETLRERILQLSYAPGEVLREVPLAAELGFSRTPVREALARLEHDGLLERTARGVRVRKRTVDEVVEVYETCLILEPEAARLAARRRTPRNLLALRDALERPDGEEGGTQVRAQLDRWHFAVWDAAHNASLAELLRHVSAQIIVLPYGPRTGGSWEKSVRSHVLLTDAIERQDAEAAGQLMTEHLSAARDLTLRVLEG
jgi:DNA-binding GntR family transcriptional regulator